VGHGCRPLLLLGREKGVGQPANDGLRAGFLITINSLRMTETTVVAGVRWKITLSRKANPIHTTVSIST